MESKKLFIQAYKVFNDMKKTVPIPLKNDKIQDALNNMDTILQFNINYENINHNYFEYIKDYIDIIYKYKLLFSNWNEFNEFVLLTVKIQQIF